MPARLLDFEALWASEKLAACDSTVRVEYAWLYGLADANGSFELNMRSIHSRVSAIRPRLTLRRLETVFAELERHGLLFTWQENGKRYAHWTKSELPGRLPKPSERHRYKKFAPPVPKERLSEYESRFCRDSVATTSPTGVGVGVGVGFGVGKGDGDGVGEGAPEARGVGASGPPPTSADAAPVGDSENPLAQTASASSPLPFRTQQLKPPVQPRHYCQYCRGAFADDRDFQRHICSARTRSGWECVDCHLTFKELTELRAHLRGCAAGSDVQRAEMVRTGVAN